MESPDKNSQVTLILKVFSIVQVMSQQREMSIKDISSKLTLNTAMVYKCLQTLCDIGYAYQNEQTKQYGLTLRFASICSNILSHYDITEIAIPTMKKIAEITKETVHLGLREDNYLIYLYKVDSPHTLRMYSSIGKTAPLYCTAIGKMLLAYEPLETQLEILNATEKIAYTQNTIIDINELITHFQMIKKQGYSEDIEEHESYIRCLSMPILDYTDKIKSALSISIPTFRWSKEIHQKNLAALKEGVSEISHKLGHNNFLIKNS